MRVADKTEWRRKFKKDYLSRWQLYLFLLLPVIYLLVFHYYPLFGIQIAFKKFSIVKGIWDSPWAGLYQFERFFSIPTFKSILYNTVSLSLYGMIAGMPMPFLLALALNAFPSQRFKRIVQSVSYMPHFISVAVIVGMLLQLFNPRVGAIGAIYLLLFKSVMPDIFADSSIFPHVYVWSGVWQGMGWGSIIYIAALSSVDQEMHESALIDGASRLQRVIHLDIPNVLPTVVIMMILAAGNLMSVGFDKVYLLQNRMNIGRSEVISTYVYKVGMVDNGGDFSFATAVGLFNNIINFSMMIIVNFVAKKVSGSSLW